MVLNRWDPFTALARLDPEFDELMRRTWGATTGRTTSGYVPAVEMRSEGPDVVITLELPGVDVARDVDIEVHDGRLTISGERRETREETGDAQGGGRTLVRELRYGSFRREFALPEGVDADAVEASYDRGMLSVRVRNVTRPVEAPRKIPVQHVSGPKTIEGSAQDSAAEATAGDRARG